MTGTKRYLMISDPDRLADEDSKNKKLEKAVQALADNWCQEGQAQMTWELTNEIRWVSRCIELDPFYVMFDELGNRVQPRATFLQQRWRAQRLGDPDKFEWRDVPTETEG